MKILLIYPPVWDPTQPFLSVPSLTAFIRKNGYKVIQKDLNIEFQDSVLNPDYLIKLLQKRKPNNLDNLKSLVPVTIANLKKSKEILKSELYYNPEYYVKAKTVIESAYQIISSFYYPTIITSKNFHMKYDSNTSYEVITATQDKNENPFIDFYEDKFIPELKNINPDIIGISLTSRSQIIPALTLCRLIKLENPNIHITLGGSLVSKLIPKLKEQPHLFKILFDSWIIGEGERPLLELIQAIENKTSLKNVCNLTYLNNEKVITNQQQSPTPVNDLPTPDFDGFPLEKYLIPNLVLPILASRGCYWRKCSFCDLYHVHGISYQRRNTEKIVEDLKYLKEKYNVTHFSFEDEAVTAKIANSIANALIESNINIKWRFQARLERQFTKDVCENLYKSGVRMMFFGLESASERVLQLMEKGIKIQDIIKVYNNTNNAGIWTYSYLIFGFPSETEEEARDTINFIVNNGDIIDSAGPSVFSLVKDAPASITPEKYMIKKVNERPMKDWEIYLDYEVESGMNQTQAAFLCGEFIKTIWDKFNNPLWISFGQEVSTLLYCDYYGKKKFKNIKYPFITNYSNIQNNYEFSLQR